MSKWTLNQKLAAAGLSVAAFTLVMAMVFPNGINGVNRTPRFMSVITLAQDIRNREPLILIDLREPELYEEFHLPTAVNMPIEGFDAKNLDGEKTAVFYSGDDPLARQLWESLPDSVRKRSFVVYGGVRDWFDRLLYPNLPLNPSGADSVLSEQINELSRFYSGQAEYVEETEALQYYKADLSKQPWPALKREGKLARRGC